MKRHLLYITNIPTPYRNHEFEAISRGCANAGLAFEVQFMARTEKGRFWDYDTSDLFYPHSFLKGVQIYAWGVPFLFNPGAIPNLIRNPPDWLMLGGSWYLPTVIMAMLVSRVINRDKTKLLIWAENPYGTKITKPAGLYLKRLILSLADGFVVPGERAREYLENTVKLKSKYIYLRNFVDESLYRDQVSELRRDSASLRDKWELSNSNRVFVTPARLNPVKGLVPFLSAVKPLCSEDFVILIAGEGPLRGELEDWITTNKTCNVRLLGNLGQEKLLEVYAIADVFVLPSLYEVHPLSTIEGLWAGLPLMLSTRVGSIPEVLVPGENGWAFDPESQPDIRGVFKAALTASDTDLKEMGRRSTELAQRRFASEACVAEFLEGLLGCFKT